MRGKLQHIIMDLIQSESGNPCFEKDIKIHPREIKIKLDFGSILRFMNQK